MLQLRLDMLTKIIFFFFKQEIKLLCEKCLPLHQKKINILFFLLAAGYADCNKWQVVRAPSLGPSDSIEDDGSFLFILPPLVPVFL